MSKEKKPTIVWVLGLYGLLGGVASILMGLWVVLDQNRLSDFASLNLTNTSLIWFGVATIAFGLFGLYLASSILAGQTWARLWYTVVATLNVIAGVWFILHHSGDARTSAVASAVFWVVTLFLLYGEKADKYFED